MNKYAIAFIVIIHREFARFMTQRSRLLSALVRPLFWLLVFAAGFKSTLGIAIQPPYSTYITYDLYVIPGLVGMVCLFNGMSSSLAMVYDREAGAMKVLMTAPLPRRTILIYKLIGTSLVSIVQVYLFLLIAMAFDVQIPSFGLVEALPAIAVSAYILALAGLILASHIQSLENFAGVMNFVIFPCFFLSSSLYPLWQIEESSEVLFWLSSFNPFPHLVELMESVYLKSVHLKWLSMIMLAWIRYTKAPYFCRGLYERTMVFSSCDSGETRTHGQWLKRPLP